MPPDYKHTLDLIKQGQWEAAHQIVQQHSDRLSCLIHAYLHRLQDDLDNAQYWYARIGEEMPTHSLEEELDRLITLVNAED